MEGALSKWTNVMKGWQYRWSVLDENAGLFSYYTSKDKMTKGVRRGCVRLRGAVIGIDHEDDATFTITVDGKTFHFQAQDSEEREKWIRALEDTVLRHNQTRKNVSGLRVVSSAANSCSIEDFDRKLSEADSYLQLMLNQISGLQQKIDDPATSSESKAKFKDILEKAVGMTESIKHAIVLLQIAKNAVLPQPAPIKPVEMSSTADLHRSPVYRPSDSSSILDSSLGTTSIQLGIEVGSECKEIPSANKMSTEIRDSASSVAAMTLAGVKSASTTLKPIKSKAIPEISYSSSEEEDFYDAEDEEEEDGRLKPVSGPLLTVSQSTMSPVNEDNPGPDAGDTDQLIDYDALYEEEDDEQDVDMKNHGSVLTHLLSQVRIGMDLTKIVLPTFILERRSLLEMYSDFFAHPDIFLAIADGQTAEDRMIRALRWYLSSFHAGRRSSIAKKPYNPILGETFRCHWRVDPDSQDPSGHVQPPCPWLPSDGVTSNDLTFVAEQVSHHPPVSAFYAEHVQKRISVNAHIYTKSSFLGMSVAVHNIGQGTVTLLDLGEEYIATFPSGFGRSILTVPWVELGGKVSIQCPSTGYLANVEFKCKQFFSSEVNKISAEVFGPGSKKPVVRIDGEWNGKMIAKWASGCNEVFMDVSKMPIHKKLCQKVALQGALESRRLWRDVTYNLKVGDIDAATAAKFDLEQRQRQEAAARKEAKEQWQTNLFKPIGDNWQFKEPLADRIKGQPASG